MTFKKFHSECWADLEADAMREHTAVQDKEEWAV